MSTKRHILNRELDINLKKIQKNTFKQRIYIHLDYELKFYLRIFLSEIIATRAYGGLKFIERMQRTLSSSAFRVAAT